jgi:glycosyltransferase involved in cell wall biosynthesis
VDVARKLIPGIKIILERKHGKGKALCAGYRASNGQVIIVMDADGSNDPREIPRFIQALIEGADLVKGTRFAPGGGTTDMPRLRKMGNHLFTMITNLLFNVRFTDLCYGYHAFWRYCLDNIMVDDVEGFEIDTAIYVRASRQHLRVTEVPSFEGYRFRGQGKLRTLLDGWRVLRTIIREYLCNIRKPCVEYYLGFRGKCPDKVPILDTLHTD